MPSPHLHTTAGGRTLVVERPRVIFSQPTGWCWYPGLWGAGTDKLLAFVSQNPDDNFNPSNTRACYRSTNDGASWSYLRNVDGFGAAGQHPYIRLSNGSIVGGEYHLTPTNGPPATAFTCDRVTWSPDLLTYTIETNAMTFTGLPQTLSAPGPTMFAWLSWQGEIIDTGAEWLTVMELIQHGQSKWTTICLRSTDLGYTWAFRGTVGTHATVPGSSEGFSESTILVVPDGRLMTCTRTGVDVGDVLYRSYSTDVGITWGAPTAMSHPCKAQPKLIKLTNNIVVLSAGNPGIQFGFSADSGGTWVHYDVTAFHEASWALDPANVRSLSLNPGDGNISLMSQYHGVREIAPNRILMNYDRMPTHRANQPNTGELGPNEIYAIEMHVT